MLYFAPLSFWVQLNQFLQVPMPLDVSYLGGKHFRAGISLSLWQHLVAVFVISRSLHFSSTQYRDFITLTFLSLCSFVMIFEFVFFLNLNCHVFSNPSPDISIFVYLFFSINTEWRTFDAYLLALLSEKCRIYSKQNVILFL